MDARVTEMGKTYRASVLLVLSSDAGRAKTRVEAAVRVKNTDEKLILTMMK